MQRRDVLRGAAATMMAAILPKMSLAAFAPVANGPWRQTRVTFDVQIPRAGKQTAQVWLPVPALACDDWIRPGEINWTGNADHAEILIDPKSGASVLYAKWKPGSGPIDLKVSAMVATRDRVVDLSTPRDVPPLSEIDRVRHTKATELIPTDGIVAETAAMITKDAETDMAKAQAIYTWIVENTARNPETRGCGLGDIASMLQLGDLTGKCADLNALFVGLARAVGLPARDLYGMRVAPSAFGYHSLGAKTEIVTKAQHCRAEVFLDGFGWVPADPADVRKVMLEEPPKNLALDDPKVVAARAALFGSWEGNWIGFNDAHDVALPGAREAHQPFLMYPEAEIDGARMDPLDPDSFTYKITAEPTPI